MGDIVNLRRARKGKMRVEAANRAAENRSRFGATLAERDLICAEQALEARRLDAHRLERPDPQGGPSGGDAQDKLDKQDQNAAG